MLGTQKATRTLSALCIASTLALFSGCVSNQVAITEDDAALVIPDMMLPLADVDAPPLPLDMNLKADVVPIAHDCELAVRADNCCIYPFYATTAAIASDPCSAALNEDLEIPAECSQQWPASCAGSFLQIKNYHVEEITVDLAACKETSQCNTDGDCVLAANYDHCCPCEQVYSAKFVQNNLCIIRLGEPFSDAAMKNCAGLNDPKSCEQVCAAAGACQSAGTPVCTAVQPGVNRCLPDYHVCK
jgi:hypothetical protein